MARGRRRTSVFEDLITILARLPWWACLTIALVAWLILHPIATSPIATAVTLNGMSGTVAGQLVRTLAFGGQFLIPFACVLAAIGSIASHVRRKKLLTNVQDAIQPGKAIDGLSWRQFEQLVGETFRRQRYSITETGGNGPDGKIPGAMQALAFVESGRCGHPRILRCHGSGGRCRWFCCHLWPVYQRS